MNAKKFFGLCVISALATSLSVAQQVENPSGNIFFGSDSLNGFNTAQCYQEALANHLNSKETSTYFYFQEKKFIDQKYHLEIPPNPIYTGNLSTLTSACNNVDFENGNFGGWTGAIGYNANSTTALTITSPAINTLGVNSPEASCSYHTIVTAASGNDPYGGFPMLDAGGGTYAVRIGGEDINEYFGSNGTYSCSAGGPGGESGGEMLQQTFNVTAANSLFTYKYAVVLDDGGHAAGEQPYFRTEVFDQFGHPIPCLQYYIQASNGVPPTGFLNSTTPNVYYLPWTSNSLNLGAYIGQTVTVRFTAAGCIFGGHFGYAYIDCSCGSVAISTSPTTCIGGIITLTAPAGGSNYQWTPVPAGPGIVGSSTGQSCNVNQNGEYQVTVTTGSGCSYVLDTVVSFSPMPITTISTANITCNGAANGSATATPSGSGPFIYSWSTIPSQTTATATGLNVGNYTVTVTASAGCTSTAIATITQPSVLKIQAAGFSATCNGTCNGYAVVIPSGGTAPYTYSWTPSGNTTANANNLCAGSYCIKVTDAHGCSTDTC
ncbi:MAG: SprB repeat-containing protein, partial [Bacteroidia bacterium]